MAPGRVQQHLRLVAILWLALSGIDVLGGILMWFVANTLFFSMQQMRGSSPPIPIGFLQTFLSAIAVLILAKAAVGFLAGWGLLQRQSWARILTIILSFFAVLSFPLGTALGVFSLWVLLPAQSEWEYAQLAAAPSA